MKQRAIYGITWLILGYSFAFLVSSECDYISHVITEKEISSSTTISKDIIDSCEYINCKFCNERHIKHKEK